MILNCQVGTWIFRELALLGWDKNGIALQAFWEKNEAGIVMEVLEGTW